MLRHLGAGHPVAERTRLGIAFLGEGRRAAEAMLNNHWIAADDLAARLGLAQRVRDSVEQTFERWDGRGVPKGAQGAQILLASRIVTFADVIEVFHRAGGTDAATEVARQRRGTQFDPELVDLFAAEAKQLCADLDGEGSWDTVMAAEPPLGVRLGAAELESALEAIADFTDVKSPYTIGHSRGVADVGTALGALWRDPLEAGAEHAHPVDAAAVRVVVRLLFDQVVAVGTANPQQVADVLATRQVACLDGHQALDVVAGVEPFAEHDVVDHLVGCPGLPMTARCQRLEVNRVGQDGPQAVAVLRGQSAREALADGPRGGCFSGGFSS